MTDAEIQRLEAIRDDESISIGERYKAAAEVFRLIERELKKAQKIALLLFWKKREGVK